MAAPTFTLPEEGTYEMDEQMREDARKECRAKAARNYTRAAELGQRMVLRAEALGWPWHSTTLATIHLGIAQVLANKRGMAQPVELTPTAAEVDATEAGVRIVLARLDAGTLFQEPSECDRAAFNELVAEECDDAYGSSSDEAEDDDPPYSRGYLTAIMATRILIRRALSDWQVGAILTNDGTVLIPQVRLRPEKKRLLDAVLYVRRVTRWRRGRAIAGEWHVEAGVQWKPRLGYDTHEAYLLNLLEVVVGALKTDSVISCAGVPEDVAMLQSALLELTELINESCGRGGDSDDNGTTDICSRARRMVQRVQGRTQAREMRHRERWVARTCAHCGSREDEPKQYKVCARCGAVGYCCKEHQVAHWKAGHKRNCKSVAAVPQPSA